MTGKPTPWFTYPMTTSTDHAVLKSAVAMDADDLSRLLRTIIKDAERALAYLDQGITYDGLSAQHARHIAEKITRIELLTGIIGRADAEEAIRSGAARRAKIEAGS